MTQRDTTKTVLLVVLFIFVIGAGISAWYVSKRFTSLEQQNIALTQQQSGSAVAGQSTSGGTSLSAARKSSASASREIITGQARQPQVGEDIQIQCFVLGDTVPEIWLQFGNTLVPQEQTAREPVEVEAGEADKYGAAFATIPGASIEPGSIYTYRCNGTTANGATVQGGISSFTSLQ